MNKGLLILKSLEETPGLSSSQLGDKLNDKIKRTIIASYLSQYNRTGMVAYELILSNIKNRVGILRDIKHYSITEKGLRKIAKLEEIQRRSISQSQLIHVVQNKLPFEDEISQKPKNNPLTELQYKYEILLAGFIGLKENIKNGKSLEQSVLHMGNKFEELLLGK